MRHAEDIIIRPIMTEKSYSNIPNGKYTFEVAVNSTRVIRSKSIKSKYIKI